MWDTTLLLLWADNGGDNPGGAASNYPLVGRKCLSWEGGTRVFGEWIVAVMGPESSGSGFV
jgi:arylsulfatase A-like enzyme